MAPRHGTLSVERTPSLAIPDWLMAGADGPEICRRFRDHAKRPYQYVIILTAKDRMRDLVDSLGAVQMTTSANLLSRASSAPRCTQARGSSPCRMKFPCALHLTNSRSAQLCARSRSGSRAQFAAHQTDRTAGHCRPRRPGLFLSASMTRRPSGGRRSAGRGLSTARGQHALG